MKNLAIEHHQDQHDGTVSGVLDYNKKFNGVVVLGLNDDGDMTLTAGGKEPDLREALVRALMIVDAFEGDT